MRRFYIQSKITDEDLKTIDIDEWVEFTKGFTISHIKELIISVFVFKYDIDEALDEINGMVDNPTIKELGSSKKRAVGFK